MPNGYFTLDEAQAALPQLTEWLGEARELKRRSDVKIALWRDRVPEGPVDMALARGEVEFLLAEVGRRLDLIREFGCLVKDIDQGLLDFPAWIPGDGKVYLCWKLGEERVSFWHALSEGFDGRKPVNAALFSLRKFS
ncbi:MAG: DUF2203 domain-containing protein [Elusimicrobia bacterium]|jgi:hypothetical protein|nr:DUF2203 domain-containing protein [Elusimicrobiota bacterium]